MSRNPFGDSSMWTTFKEQLLAVMQLAPPDQAEAPIGHNDAKAVQPDKMHLGDMLNEILILVFQSLSDLDDVMCLAATNRHFREIYASNTNSILRRVIEGSIHHQWDAGLSQLCTIVEPCRESLRTSELPFLDENKRVSWTTLDKYDSPCCCHISQQELRAIVSRWLLTRKFYNLYTDVRIQHWYMQMPEIAELAHSRHVGAIEKLASGEKLPSIIAKFTEGTKPRLPEQQALKNFHHGLSRFWFCVEAHRHVHMCHIRGMDMCTYWAGHEVEQIWSGLKSRCLIYNLMMVEVVDFLYGFILKHTLLGINPPLCDCSFTVDEGLCVHRGSMIMTTSAFLLSPADIAKTMERLHHKTLNAYELRITVASTGFYDAMTDVRQGSRAGLPFCVRKIGSDFVDDVVRSKMWMHDWGKTHEEAHHYAAGRTLRHGPNYNAWMHYRQDWKKTGRGQIFSWPAQEHSEPALLRRFKDHLDAVAGSCGCSNTEPTAASADYYPELMHPDLQI